MDKSIDVSVVIVTFESAGVVAECLRTLPREDRLEVHVVDNGSMDESAQLVTAEYPGAKVTINKENVGFARAVNLVAGNVAGRFILLLNPDATIDGDAIARLVSLMDSDTSIGIASPLVDEAGGKFATVAAGLSPTIWRMFTHATGLSRLAGRVRILAGHYLLRPISMVSGPIPIDWVSGGCMLVRSDVWRDLGGLTERWFMYAEDIEFCLRVRRAGYRVVLDPLAHATHAVGQSTAGRDGQVGVLWLENLFDLYRSNIAVNPLQPLIWRLVVASGFRVRAAFLRVKNFVRAGSAGTEADILRFTAYASALRKRKQ